MAVSREVEHPPSIRAQFEELPSNVPNILPPQQKTRRFKEVQHPKDAGAITGRGIGYLLEDDRVP